MHEPLQQSLGSSLIASLGSLSFLVQQVLTCISVSRNGYQAKIDNVLAVINHFSLNVINHFPLNGINNFPLNVC